MWSQIAANRRRSVLLVFAMLGLLIALGFAIGEMIGPGLAPVGIGIAVALWATLTLVAFAGGDKILLSVSGARKVDHDAHPQLFNIVEEMKIASGLTRMPDVYIIEDPSPNAFATGRSEKNAAVAVTTGLLRILDRTELQGVIAHEIAHVKNRDVLLMVVAGVMVGAIVMLADVVTRAWFWGGFRSRRTDSGGNQGHAIAIVIGLVLMILAPIFAQLIYFAISRRREYLADASAAVFTRYPLGLASALRRISSPGPTLRNASRATAPMFIVNPLASEARAARGLSATHPPTADRIAVLESMAGASLDDYNRAWSTVMKSDTELVPESDRKAVPEGAMGLADPSDAYPDGEAARKRAANDALLRVNGYVIVDCVCGNRLKVPPEASLSRVKCPTCRTEHDLAR